jgi:hypothetical protein
MISLGNALKGGHSWGDRPIFLTLIRLHPAVIRVYDDAGNVIETHEHAGDFVEP